MNADDLRTSAQAARFDRINMLFDEIVDMGSESYDRCQVAKVALRELREWIDKSVYDSNNQWTPHLWKSPTMMAIGFKPCRYTDKREATI